MVRSISRGDHNNYDHNNVFTAPVGVTLLADRQVFAVVGVVVAAVSGRERPANVVARRTAHL